jgi:hypothetical protein
MIKARIIILMTGAAVGVLAAGCGSHDQSVSNEPKSPPPQASLPPQFAFIQTNLHVMTVQEVADRVGNYSRVGHLRQDDATLTYEFDLPDGSAVLLTPERPFEARNRVHSVQFFLSTNDFHLYP